MKPKTELQKQIVKLSGKLPALTEKQRRWGIMNAMDHVGLRLKKGLITCTHCGKIFYDLMKLEDGEMDICPNCGTHLKIETTTRKSCRDNEYFNIITTCHGFQVFRYFYIRKEFHSGKEASYCIREVVQNWMSADGKFKTMALLANMHSYYRDAWCLGTDLEIRANDKEAYHIGCDACYPVRRYLSAWKKYGFKGKVHSIYALDFFRLISTDSTAETLLKAGQYELLRMFCAGKDYEIKRTWPTIKICMRNNYVVKDASMWFDYLDLLGDEGKDLRNAHYVCPDNLNSAHDFYMERKRRKEEKERRQRDMKQMEALKKYEKEYEKLKSRFFDLNISDGSIIIVPLKSLDEFRQEGQIMHHCVFTNNYFRKKDSLILSARIGEKHIETIEVDLSKFQVIQSRGICNKDTEYHGRIIDLVKKNMNLIRQKLTA